MDAEPSAVISDSGGVVIQTSTPDRSTPDWQVAHSRAVLVRDDLYRIRGATFLDDGLIAVANAGAFDVRIYSPEGLLLVRRGRRGDGPGEYQALTEIHSYRGDSLIVFDRRARRYSVLDNRGQYVRSFSAVGPEGGPTDVTLEGATDSGELIMITLSPIVPASPPGIIRPTETLLRYGPTGAVIGPIGPVPGAEQFVDSEGGGWPRSFGRRTVALVVGSEVLVTTGDAYEVRVYGLDGALRRVLRIATEPLEVLPQHIAVDRDRLRRAAASFVGLPAHVRQRYYATTRSMSYPTVFPALTALRHDDAGRLLLRTYPPPGATETTWFVLGPSGAVVARLHLPAGMVLHDLRDQRALVSWEDSLDVEHVGVARIVQR
ncbi:MAG: hypothetical protein OEY20_14175 [Gemmatimonadota bacterium]|nr:hypothetical protein [Gemmatimonadota bacterium]MDH5198385.1 hypothetical protein [Gemmatimonadota bacterium]